MKDLRHPPVPPVKVPGREEREAEPWRTLDRYADSLAAPLTGGLSGAGLALAWFDWAMHLATAPGKQLSIATKAARKSARIASFAACRGTAETPGHAACIEPLPGDNRFRDPAWQQPPFDVIHQAFLLNQQLWHNVTTGVPGVAPHHEEVMTFAARQFLDVFSPSNNPFTNPEVLARARETGGLNFVRGWKNWLEDLRGLAGGKPQPGTEGFTPGREVAVTPGQVVFRNHLIELIQYAPTTAKVRAEPVLIVPAWIMKYYILDLSPQNSLIRHLVGEGFTVFAISWRNPGAEDRDLGLDDYRRLGVLAALKAIGRVVPGARVHATGYCLGGTLLSIVAAALARQGDNRLASLTLLAAQTDFTEPGELALFIDDSQLRLLDAMMWKRGYLSADQMSGAFQLLRSNDLVWSRMVRDYLMGDRLPPNDLMAWNADATRMPHRMHADYLRRLYLENELAGGRFMVDGRPVALQDIRAPIFAVGTERDHVAPWRSVHKIHMLTDTDVTFVLTSGGHNAGIVSEPGHRGRAFRILEKRLDDPLLGPEDWARAADEREGSWWPAWAEWLAARSSGETDPPSMGAAARGLPPLEPAPGSYVHQH